MYFMMKREIEVNYIIFVLCCSVCIFNFDSFFFEWLWSMGTKYWLAFFLLIVISLHYHLILTSVLSC